MAWFGNVAVTFRLDDVLKKIAAVLATIHKISAIQKHTTANSQTIGESNTLVLAAAVWRVTYRTETTTDGVDLVLFLGQGEPITTLPPIDVSTRVVRIEPPDYRALSGEPNC